MTSSQSPWPAFPVHLGLPYELTVHGPRYIANDYASVVWPSQVIPHSYKPVAERPKDSRKFFLNRSVFDLVDAHQYLALTDPKLLGWYLHLSPEDRKIIQDEGGFHQFLLNHPALELSTHHVYVKRWEVFPNVRETFRLFGCIDSRDGFHNQPHDKFRNTEQVQQQDIFQASLQEMNKDKSSMPDDARSSSPPSALASFSVDMNAERQRTPEFRSQTAMTRGQSADLPLVEVSPVQSQEASAERESLPVDSAGDDKATLSLCSIMKDDQSILACVPLEDVKPCKSGIEVGPVSTNSEALTTRSESSVSAQTVLRCHPAGVNTSPVPHVATCDAMTGTELPLCTSASTQTDSPHACDKHVITEVHMADLDYLAEEFMKIKMATKQTEKVKGLGCKLHKECECFQHAQQSELQLLALQYSMCRQYCWRIYSTCAEGDQLSPLLMMPPAKFASILQKLQSDYSQMKEKILAGVPLQRLQPLSVDAEKIIRGARCIPAEILSDVLGEAPSWSSLESCRTSEQARSCASQSRAGCKQSQRKEQVSKNKARTAVTLIPQDKAAACDAKEKTLTPVFKEFNTGEAWYDAEEDLELTGPAAVNEEDQAESASETSKCSIRCVSALPSEAAESDMLLLNKYNACEVSFSALKNDQRWVTALSKRLLKHNTVTTKSLPLCQRAYFACGAHQQSCDEGHSQSVSVIKDPREPQSTTRAETKLINESASSSSLRVRKVVCISPTAKGTCVPQHYGTMASFDILMAELTQRHPDVGRQQIVDALMELKAQDRGVLSSLPLSTIRDMTSALLTRPARNTLP